MRIGFGKNTIEYMYDKILDQLFENNGNGKFLVGPDKK